MPICMRLGRIFISIWRIATGHEENVTRRRAKRDSTFLFKFKQVAWGRLSADEQNLEFGSRNCWQVERRVEREGVNSVYCFSTAGANISRKAFLSLYTSKIFTFFKLDPPGSA